MLAAQSGKAAMSSLHTRPERGRTYTAAALLAVGALLICTRAAGAPSVGPAEASRGAHAGERGTTAAREIWLEARPWTCVHEIGALARDTELACDALGGRCQIASSESEATRRAVLVCSSAERWTLRIETQDGQPLVVLPLTGDREERLRKAAMWLARVEDEGPIEGPPTAALTPAPNVVVVRPPPMVSVEPGFAQLAADDAALQPKPKLPRVGGLTVDAYYGPTNSSIIHFVWGVHGTLAHPVGPFHMGPAGAYEAATDGDESARMGRLGWRFGWGAPFGHRIFGLWLESGVAWGTRKSPTGTSIAEIADRWTRPTDFMTPYGRAEIMLQVPLKAPLRPYVTAGGMQTVNEFGEGAQLAFASAGLAWRAW